MKFLYVLPLAALAALGIFINSAYYFDSFINAGYPVLFAKGLSGSFMGLESVIWLYPVRSKYIPFLKFSIIVFSISATLGSQFFSTSKMESDIEKIVYQELGSGEDIQWYRDQIGIQNKTIEDINKMRAEKLVFTLSESSMINAMDKRDEYQGKINQLEDRRESGVEKINKPMSVYSFYAYRVPEILTGDFGEDFIRVIFQLVSSVILALVAPICLSMIKVSTFTGKAKKSKPATNKPQNKPISDKDKARIARIMLYAYPEKAIVKPVDVERHFKTLKKGNSELREYSLAECMDIYGKISAHVGKDKKIIMEEVLR